MFYCVRYLFCSLSHKFKHLNVSESGARSSHSFKELTMSNKNSVKYSLRNNNSQQFMFWTETSET